MTKQRRDVLVEENQRLKLELARLRSQNTPKSSVKFNCETGRCPLAVTTHAVLWKMDSNTRKFTFISPHIEQWLGYPADSWIGLETCNERLHPDDRHIIDKIHNEAIEHGSEATVDYRLIRAGGEIVWVRDVISIDRCNPSTPSLIGFMIDISDHNKIEKALKESEEKYRSLMQSAGDAIFVADAETGILVDANRQASELIGWNQNELIGMHHTRLHPTAEREYYNRQFISQIGGRSSGISLSSEVQHRNGSLIPVEINAASFMAGDRRLVQGIFRNISERKQTEIALQKSEENLRTIFDNIQDTFYRSDLSGKIIDLSPSVAELISIQAKDLIGKQLADYYVDPHGREKFLSALVDAGGEVRNYEALIRKGDGQQIWVATNAQYYRDEMGEIAGIEGTIRDITERKLSEEKNLTQIRTLESLQKIADAINSPLPSNKVMDDVIAIILEIFTADRAWLLYPCDPEADSWEVPVEATLPQYPGALALKQKISLSAEVTQVFREVLASDQPVVCCPMLTGDPNTDPFAVKSQIIMAIHPKHGKAWALGLHQCSYERQWSDEDQQLFAQVGKRMTVLLGSTHQDNRLRKLSSAVQQAGESVLITDRTGSIEYINPAFTAITGYSAEEVIGKSPSILKSDAQDPAYYKELWETVTRGDVWHGTLIDRKKDGSFYPALMTVAPVHDDHDNITHFVATQQDMTEYKRLEEQFFEAQKLQAIGTLAGGIAHDFNNMLAALQGNLFLVRQHSKLSQKTESRLNSVDMIIVRAASMVRQLLTYARKDRVTMTPFSLNSFMKEGFKMLKTAIPENIEHVCDLCQDELIIHGDAMQLQQALMNLLINARDAVEGSRQPKINCSLAPYSASIDFLNRHPELIKTNFARLTVSDNGSGINHDKLNKIFEPFFTTKEVGKGTGLGLAMVYGSIITHGGVIEVESEAGKGSAFHIYLPLEEQSEPEQTKTKPAISQGESETILLVDDEETLRIVTAEVLRDMGYVVLEGVDGKQALRIFNSHHIDLILTDIVMPILGGIELAREVRKQHANMPIIFMTGYDKAQTLGYQKEFEHSNVLNKPFEFENLSHMIRQLLSN